MRVFKNNDNPINDQKIIDQLRCLSIDMINEAQSGHPGIALGAAPIIYSLYAYHMRINQENPKFYNRDRFVLSAGHGSALLYSTLFLAGYNIELDDLKTFRQIDSKFPGHPEVNYDIGVDVSTGALEQGLAMAVGMAMGEAHISSMFKKSPVDFRTYCLVGDGDLMEGVSYEAAALAGVNKLNKLIVLYDSNNITIDGNTNLVSNNNIREIYETLGWKTILVETNTYENINKAIEDAKSSDKPTLIEIKSIIGQYSINQGTNLVHSKPLSEEDTKNIKEKLNIRDIPFTISLDAMEDFQYLINIRCQKLEEEFNTNIENLDDNEKKILNYLMNDNKSITDDQLDFLFDDDDTLTSISGKVLNAYYSENNILFGGSADLFQSCKNYINDKGAFSSSDYTSPNIYFGVREHAMGAILNGISLVGLRSYGSTFLTFSDYLKPAIRMSAIMNLPVIYMFSHDSIAIGEDGVTHQPVEQLSNLRNIPNLDVFRPCDANEVLGSYKAIMSKESGPSALVLSKSQLPIIESTSINDVSLGGYIVKNEKLRLDGILIGSGEEVHTLIELSERLFNKGIDTRVVSMPNLNRFLSQDKSYIDEILPVEKRKVVVEMSNSNTWKSIVFNDKYLILQNSFGASGKKIDVLKKFGFDIDSLEEKIENLLS